MGKIRRGYEKVRDFLFVVKKKVIFRAPIKIVVLDANKGTEDQVDFSKPVETINVVHQTLDGKIRKVSDIGKDKNYSSITLNQGWANLIKNRDGYVKSRLVLCNDEKYRIIVEGC